MGDGPVEGEPQGRGGRPWGARLRSGAVEAWWAHNPQVPRSKLGSETFWGAREAARASPLGASHASRRAWRWPSWSKALE